MTRTKINQADYKSCENYVTEYIVTWFLLFDNSAKVKRQKTFSDKQELLYFIVDLIASNENLAEIKISVRRYKHG